MTNDVTTDRGYQRAAAVEARLGAEADAIFVPPDTDPDARAIDKADELIAAVMQDGIGYYPRVALMQARVELARALNEVFELDCDVCHRTGVRPGQDWKDCDHALGTCPDCKEDCGACKGQGSIKIEEAK